MSNIVCVFLNQTCGLLHCLDEAHPHIYPEYCAKRCGESDEAKRAMLKRHGIRLSVIPRDMEELRQKIQSGEIKTKPIQKPAPTVYTEPVKELPGVFAMAKNLAGTGAAVIRKAITDHRVLCCDSQRAEREVECGKCQHREVINNHERCVSFKGGEAGCGCFLEHKRKLAAARCNLGKWDLIDVKYDIPQSDR